MKTLFSIQYLRAFAALSVVVYHACQWNRGFPFPTGAAGVDIFFVVSGFVMWWTAERAPVSPFEFLRRRAVRILPPYWVITLAAAALATWAPGVIQAVLVDGRHLVLSLLLIPHRDPHGEPFPLLKPGWTLEYEALFYLVFAAVLFAPRGRRLEIITAGLIGLSLLGWVWPEVEYMANPLQLEFLAGVWIARLRIEGVLPRPLVAGVLIAAAFAAFAFLQSQLFNAYHWRWLLWGAPAGLIVLGVVSLEFHLGLFRSRVLKLLGDGSYSIYLCHPLAIQAVGFCLVDSYANFPVFMAVALSAALGVGLLCRQLVEKPLLALLHARPRRTEAEPASTG